MLKSQRLSFHLAAAAAVLTAISLVLFFVTNATVSYAVTDGPIAIACTILAILLCGGSVFLQARGAGEFLPTVLRLLTLSLLMAAFTIVLSDRALVAGVFLPGTIWTPMAGTPSIPALPAWYSSCCPFFC